MKVRVCLALVAVFCLTAFAPAPLPRRVRRTPDLTITLAALQGTWRAIDIVNSRSDGRHTPDQLLYSHVRISQDRWTFLAHEREVNNFTIEVTPTGSMAKLTLHNGAQKTAISGVGLIRRHGRQIQILYTWNTSANLSFDPPSQGGWILTLER